MPPTARDRQSANGGNRLARRALSTGVAVVVVCGISVSASSAGPFTHSGHDYVTRPDLHPPEIEVTTPATNTVDGEILTTPIPPLTSGVGAMLNSPPQGGAMITDDQGEPLWFRPARPGTAITDLQVQEYQGKPVLTWWEGKLVVPPGMGFGKGMILDESYNVVAEVKMGNGVQADIHDFQITPRNTALLMAYHPVPMDLTAFGGPKDGQVLENVVQEVDIATGEVLLDWRSLQHVGLDESWVPPSPDPSIPWDYLHVNSVAVDTPGNLLISARSTHALYQLNRQTGQVNWRLNGKKSDFNVELDAQFQWQHDARRLPDGTISVFDNAIPEKERARGVVIALDEVARTATEVRSDWRPAPIVSPNMGNYQLLENGSAFLGWGGADGVTELGSDQTVRYEQRFADGMTSYRAYRENWVGTPSDPPSVAAESGSGGKTDVYASWNGATEVAKWRVLTGPTRQELNVVAEGDRQGFETKVSIDNPDKFVVVEALDANGQVLGRSAPDKVS